METLWYYETWSLDSKDRVSQYFCTDTRGQYPDFTILEKMVPEGRRVSGFRSASAWSKYQNSLVNKKIVTKRMEYAK